MLRRIFSALTVAALALGVMAGCSTPAEVPADWTQLMLNNTMTPSTGGKDLKATFVMPHFGVKQQEVLVTESVDADTAERLGLNKGEAFAASSGQEIVIATLNQRSDGRFPDDIEAKVELAVGETKTPIDQWPAPQSNGGVVLAVSAKKGAPVTLQVTDEKKVVSWDLRTGTYAKDDVSAAAAGLAKASTKESAGTKKEADGQASYDLSAAGQPAATGVVRVTLDASAATFRVTPYLPGLGWAKPGTTWASLSEFNVSYASKTVTATGTQVTEPSAAYSFTPEGGKPQPLVGGNVGSNAFEVDMNGDYVVFAVPPDTTAGTFIFTPQANLQVITPAGGSTAKWTTRPKAISIPLSYA